MTGTTDKPHITTNPKGRVQDVVQKIKGEKQTVKSLLKDNFGLFKKDTTLKKAPVKSAKFKLKVDGDEKKQEEKKTLKKPKKPEEDNPDYK